MSPFRSGALKVLHCNCKSAAGGRRHRADALFLRARLWGESLSTVAPARTGPVDRCRNRAKTAEHAPLRVSARRLRRRERYRTQRPSKQIPPFVQSAADSHSGVVARDGLLAPAAGADGLGTARTGVPTIEASRASVSR